MGNIGYLCAEYRDHNYRKPVILRYVSIRQNL
ncbi:hypothetical protein F0726_02343 [Acidithiobacillus caldus]|nr:hypothetical protein F0726_02343 [Acidithiobacillus caldus]